MKKIKKSNHIFIKEEKEIYVMNHYKQLLILLRGVRILIIATLFIGTGGIIFSTVYISVSELSSNWNLFIEALTLILGWGGVWGYIFYCIIRDDEKELIRKKKMHLVKMRIARRRQLERL